MHSPDEHLVPNHYVLCQHGQLRPILPQVTTRLLVGPHELTLAIQEGRGPQFELPACHLMTTYVALESSMDAKLALQCQLSIHPSGIKPTQHPPALLRVLREHRVKR